MKCYVTTPIYYVNDEPTVGHAYSTIAADVLARYHRLRGDDVFFATGTDENALKVLRAAQQKGLDPHLYVDQMADRFREEWRNLNIAYDDFIRTTEERHHRAVQAFLQALYQSGDLYLGDYEGWYCVSDETYFREEELVEGRCPNPECQRKVEWLTEPAYFFRFSKYGDRLLEHIERNPDFLLPDFRKNEVVSFIRSGLRDACVSRRSAWGVPMPSSIPHSQGMVVYVWADALVNYLTCAGYPDDREMLAKYWPADVHVVGKDIFVRFHATLWPAMLMAAGLALPRQVVAHGYWTLGGRKISKSRGAAMPRPGPVLDTVVVETGCPRPRAVDALRYYMLREVPFGQDGEFSGEALLGRYTDDLANDLGNLVQRVLPMIGRYRRGRMPPKAPPDPDLHPAAQAAAAGWERALESLDFRGGLEAIWSFLRTANRYIDKEAPWALAKAGNEEALDRVLYSAAEAIRIAALLVAPVMPDTTDEIEGQLGLRNCQRQWAQAYQWGLLPAGQPIGQPTPLFPRSEPTTSAPTPTRDAPGRDQRPASQERPMISLKEFQKVDLRVAEILAAEPIAGADKLLKLTVNLGDEQRTMVAGIALSYRPQDLVGRKVVVVANLEPATIRGVKSEGMILAGWIEGDEGSVALVAPDRPLPNGAAVT